MLINKTTVKHKKSIYICDSCQKQIQVEDRVRIDRNTKKNMTYVKIVGEK